jgi:hypothetical protein
MATLYLKLSDLEEEYQTKTYEEQVMIANIGAVCYRGLGEVMREQLKKELTFNDKVKMDSMRKTMENEVLRPLQDSNKALTEARMNIVMLETQVMFLQKQASVSQEEIDKEVQRRLQYEYSVQLSELNNEIAILKVKEDYHRKTEDYVKDLQEEKVTMRKLLNDLDSENKALQDEIKKTLQKEHKTLRDIGKEGEACVKNLLDTFVKDEFKKVVVTDVSHIGHAGDFHLSLTTPETKRIKILIDSKKYTSAVTNVNIHKIMADVDKDDEVTAGLLISIDSSISAKKQFQVDKTPKCKPLLYLTFEDLEDEMRGYVLCLAVRTIITLVSGYSELEKDIMIDNIELFLKEVGETVKDLNSLAIQCKRMNESILKLRLNLIEKINKFQSLAETPEPVEMEEIIEIDEPIESTTRCKGSTKNGARCKFSCTMNSEYCQKHSK